MPGQGDLRPPRRGFVVGPDAGHPLTGAGGALLAGAADTGGLFSLIRSHAPAGDHVPRHVHASTDEGFFVLEGEYRVDCGADTFHASAGTFVYLPRGVPHAYTVGPTPATKLILAVPAGIEDFFVDLDAGLSADDVMHRHGVTFLPS